MLNKNPKLHTSNSNNIFREVFHNNVNGILILDRKGNIWLANPTAEILLGRNSEELFGTPFGIPAAEGKMPQLRVVHKDGKSVFVELGLVKTNIHGEVVYIVNLHDITGRVKQRRKKHDLLLVDDLTGLYPRQAFFDLGERQKQLADRTNTSFTLLFAEVNYTEQINHLVSCEKSNRVLREIASILKETFRGSDVIARIGRGEFVVIAIDARENTAEMMMARLRAKLDARNAREDRPRETHDLALHIGVATYDPWNPCSIKELLQRAIERIYHQNGRKVSVNGR